MKYRLSKVSSWVFLGAARLHVVAYFQECILFISLIIMFAFLYEYVIVSVNLSICLCLYAHQKYGYPVTLDRWFDWYFWSKNSFNERDKLKHFIRSTKSDENNIL